MERREAQKPPARGNVETAPPERYSAKLHRCRYWQFLRAPAAAQKPAGFCSQPHPGPPAKRCRRLRLGPPAEHVLMYPQSSSSPKASSFPNLKATHHALGLFAEKTWCYRYVPLSLLLIAEQHNLISTLESDPRQCHSCSGRIIQPRLYSNRTAKINRGNYSVKTS
jgi:hypothetical protein